MGLPCLIFPATIRKLIGSTNKSVWHSSSALKWYVYVWLLMVSQIGVSLVVHFIIGVFLFHISIPFPARASPWLSKPFRWQFYQLGYTTKCSQYLAGMRKVNWRVRNHEKWLALRSKRPLKGSLPPSCPSSKCFRVSRYELLLLIYMYLWLQPNSYSHQVRTMCIVLSHILKKGRVLEICPVTITVHMRYNFLDRMNKRKRFLMVF